MPMAKHQLGTLQGPDPKVLSEACFSLVTPSLYRSLLTVPAISCRYCEKTNRRERRWRAWWQQWELEEIPRGKSGFGKSWSLVLLTETSQRHPLAERSWGSGFVSPVTWVIMTFPISMSIQYLSPFTTSGITPWVTATKPDLSRRAHKAGYRLGPKCAHQDQANYAPLSKSGPSVFINKV